MAVDGITPAVVFPLFNFILRGVQTVYEVASVPAETTDYLKTISQVLADVKIVRQLRRRMSGSVSKDDLNRIDDVINNTEDAMKGVEILVEKARVDMALKPGRVSASGRIMWVIRDQNKMAAAMSRLAIASQSLHREIIMIKTMENSPSNAIYQAEKPAFVGSPWSDSSNTLIADTSPSPPSYLQATIDSMRERRYWNDRRNSLARQRSHSSAASSINSDELQFPPLVPIRQDMNGPSMASLDNIADYIRHNEEILSTIAPEASNSPRDRLLPAKVIDSPHVADPLRSTFELEGSKPQPAPKPTSLGILSHTQLPTLGSQQKISPALYPVMPQTFQAASWSSPVLMENGQVQPPLIRPLRSQGHLPRSAMQQTTRKQPELIESEILLPGHTKPYRLRYEEVDDEVDPFKPNTTILDHHEEDERIDDVESELARVPTRRRPPRVQRDLHISATVPQVPANHQTAIHRNTDRTLSRSEWQLQKQDEELARLRQRETGFS